MPEYSTEGPWRVDIQGPGETHWASNALRFETKEEAEEYAVQKSWSWFTMKGYRVVPTDHPQREAVDYEATAEAGFISRDLS